MFFLYLLSHLQMQVLLKHFQTLCFRQNHMLHKKHLQYQGLGQRLHMVCPCCVSVWPGLPM